MNRAASKMHRGCSELIRSSVLAGLLLLTGCAYHGGTFSPAEVTDETRALVYIYRPAQYTNAMLSPSVMIDGEAVFDTQAGAYAAMSLPAGTHRFSLESEQHLTGNDALSVQIDSGEVSYLRIDTALKFQTGKPYTRRFDIVRVDGSTALNELVHCRQQQVRLPSKYQLPAVTTDLPVDEVHTDETAKFTIDKSSDPFAAKRSPE